MQSAKRKLLFMMFTPSGQGLAATLTRIIHSREYRFPSLTQRFRQIGTRMIQLALSVADSSASTLHANPRGAPGLSQQSRLPTESKPKYISTCSQLILQRKSKQVGNHPSLSLSGAAERQRNGNSLCDCLRPRRKSEERRVNRRHGIGRARR